METINNKIPEKAITIFNTISTNLDTKLYFYGSVQRPDYFPEDSDIDVDIFVNNEKDAISKLQYLLNRPKNKFKKIIWKLQNNETVYGYKVSYKKPEYKIRIEFSIFNNKYKNNILNERKVKILLPWYASFLLIILKFFYYRLNIIDREMFKYLKNKIMSVLIGKPEYDFVVLDNL
jgi:Nucleotidyltransferase domain